MKLKVKKEDFNIIKAYFQIQILLETLDDVYDESKLNLKNSTKNYLNKLKIKAEPILKTMYDSNSVFFQKISNDLRNSINKLEDNFEII